MRKLLLLIPISLLLVAQSPIPSGNVGASTSGGLSFSASGTITINPGSITGPLCSTAQTATATGALTTDVINITANADPTGTTGYVPLTTGSVYWWVYPTSDTVNVKVCYNGSGVIVPGSRTANWSILRP